MIFRIAFGFLMSLALAGGAWAQPAKWQVDQANSSLQFVVDVNGQTVTGKFAAFGALIAFDPADLAHSSAKITIDMTAFKSGDATRDALLLKPDWFNVLDFPKSVFQTTSFVAKGGDKYEAHGQLQLKGSSKEVVLPFTLTITGDKAVMSGETVLQRTDFKVGAGSQFATGKPVALDVKVLVNVTAMRAK
jgi:polyisoprenoid-binding protein YceI